MVIVGRYINGVTINPLEYLLDDDSKTIEFATEEEAKMFLDKKGYTDDFLVFELVYSPKDIVQTIVKTGNNK